MARSDTEFVPPSSLAINNTQRPSLMALSLDKECYRHVSILKGRAVRSRTGCGRGGGCRCLYQLFDRWRNHVEQHGLRLLRGLEKAQLPGPPFRWCAVVFAQIANRV